MAEGGSIVVPDEARAGFGGRLLAPGDDGYEDARRVHNGLIDKRPGLVARCATTADVVTAVAIARDQGAELSVRGGGHNVAGKAVTDGGVMVDLAGMRAVAVDPDRRTARAEGGATWGDFNLATAAHNLATTGGTVSTTGVAGLTLGGGFGWLMGKHGMTIDNLVEVELVTADGQVLTVNEEQHPDLFWALRGGGGNFGVAASFTYRLHPLTNVLGGIIAYPVDEAMAVFDRFRTSTKEASDELALGAGFLRPAGADKPFVGIPICHAGDLAAAEAEIAPLRTELTPALEIVGEVPYPITNTILDASFPRLARNYWKSAFFTEFSDTAIQTMVEAYADAPSELTLLTVEHLHGAATRVDPTATAYPHRAEGYNLLILSQWSDPADDRANIAWARDTFDALRPFTADRRYVNYLSADDGDAVRQAYGPNYDRLVDAKRRYDPTNLFRLNQNIPPG